MSNNITIELSKTDRALLEDVVGHLGLLVGMVGDMRPTAAPLKAVELLTEPEQPEPVNEQTVEEVSPEPLAEPELPKYTPADIQAKVRAMAGPSNPKREKAKAIVTSYGKKVSDIPEDKYTEAMMRLIELEQEPLEG